MTDTNTVTATTSTHPNTNTNTGHSMTGLKAVNGPSGRAGAREAR